MIKEIKSFHKYFKRAIETEDISNIVDKRIGDFTKKDFYSRYRIKDETYLDFVLLDDYIPDRFVELCQHFITTYFYSKSAKTHSLPFLFWTYCSKKMNLSQLATEHSSTAYYNKEHNYIVFKEIGNYGYQLISQNRTIPNFSPTNYIMRYGLAFYYAFFGQYELDLFNYEFTKYSSNEKAMSNQKLISLLNRVQGLKEENDFREIMTREFNDKWLYLISGKAEPVQFNTDYFMKAFDKAFSYFKVVNDFYLAKLNKWLSIIALIVSFVGLIVAIISIFVTGQCAS